MSHPIIIENEAIRLQVWPTIGGKVSSIVDKADAYELLFNYPAELPQSPTYDMPYGNGWYAGWDECFPAVAKSNYLGHPYDGISVPDHGELWGIPVTTAVPNKNGVTTVWHGLRFGYRLTRKLYLEGATMIADYTLINLAPFEFKFVWAMHSLMSLVMSAKLELGGSSAFKFSHDAAGGDFQTPFEWPHVEEKVNLSDLSHVPPRLGWKVFSVDPIDGPMVVRYPTRGRTVKIEYSSEDQLPAYWGIWLNSGAWAGHRHFAVEPTTGRFDQIDRSIKDYSAGTVPPAGRRDWSVRWSLGI